MQRKDGMRTRSHPLIVLFRALFGVELQCIWLPPANEWERSWHGLFDFEGDNLVVEQFPGMSANLPGMPGP